MTLQEAAQQALDALVKFREWEIGTDYDSDRHTVLAQAFAAEEALAAVLEQLPVKTYCGGKPNYAARQTFSEWWDSDELAHFNPYKEGTPIFWAFEGWEARHYGVTK